MDLVKTIVNHDDFKYFSKSEKISSSILLISKDDIYSLEFAKVLASFIMDGKIDEDSENFKKIMLLSHPDVCFYPKKDKLLVSDSEEIVTESFVKPVFSNKKIFIIKNIDNSMESAQNKLLKTLEEPANNVFIILTCANSDLVLPTIKSRCLKRELAKLSEEEIVSYLPKEENALLSCKLCDGGIGKAVKLLQNPSLFHIAKLGIEILTKMKSSKQILEFSKRAQGFSKNLDIILEVLLLAIEDLLKIKTGCKCTLSMFEQELKAVSEEYSIRALCQINQKLIKMQKEISYNVNQIVSFENLLLNILEVKYLCK